MNSICNFIPAKKSGDHLRLIHFVYETELRRLKQPFIQPLYYMYLVIRGTGTLRIAGGEHPLAVGTLFFTFPGTTYEIADGGNLTYMYISFMGTRGTELITESGITVQSPTYSGFDGVIPFWRNAIQRINPQNANLLAESVMLYTLSYLAGADGTAAKTGAGDSLESIVNYIDNHYTDPNLSLKQIADIYAYTDKYLSHLFKTKMNINWSTYVNRLRVQHALRLIGDGERNLYDIAAASGYRDVMYFSKVFKKFMQRTPREYISDLINKQISQIGI